MATEYVLDTHALLWAIQAGPQLGPAARSLFADPATRFHVPAIGLAEAAWVVALGRTRIPNPADLFRVVTADARIRVVPLDRAIVERGSHLTTIHEMHDRQIVATTLVLADAGVNVALVTKDSDIVAAGVVPIVW